MPDYRTGAAARGTRPFSALSGMLNLKRQFEDAKRQMEFKLKQDYLNNQSQMNRQNISYAVDLARGGLVTPEQFKNATSYTEPYTGQQVPGMNINEGGRAGIGIYLADPVTGELTQTGTAPYGSRVLKGVMSPDDIRERGQVIGEVKASQKDIEASQKLSTAVKRLSILNRQFKEALPSGDRTPFEQRIAGSASSFAAKYGLINNPKLLALQKNLRPIAINLIRLFGEVGNLSETEQQGALDTVNKAGLTDAERIEQTKQFIEFALSGASPEGITYLKKRKDIQGILDAFGVDLGIDSNVQPGTTSQSGKTSSGVTFERISD